MTKQQFGAAEARRAHNPEVLRSKLRIATSFALFATFFYVAAVGCCGAPAWWSWRASCDSGRCGTIFAAEGHRNHKRDKINMETIVHCIAVSH